MPRIPITEVYTREADAIAQRSEDGYDITVPGVLVYVELNADGDRMVFATTLPAGEAEELAAQVAGVGTINPERWVDAAPGYGSVAWQREQDEGGQLEADLRDEYEAAFEPPTRYSM